ncbi:MAG: serine hydrolase [Pseudomonadota bacterium]
MKTWSRMASSQGVRVVTLSLAILFLGWAIAPRSAIAAPYAAIVMDMRDGTVFHARSADHAQQPASLTKMMTLYLTFEAIQRGQLSLDQKVRVSRKAARQPPSKLYLKAGQRVTIRSLIRAAAIKSANDAAMVLAEAISGSEAAFAKLMTSRARQLGMKNTTFRNPHGLTQSGHRSTARDMAKLARRLYFDFPKYYNVFGKKSSRAAGKRIWTTNRLIGSYRGAEGMKTGYTRAAGYNLVAIAARGQERVIAVVMGGKSSGWRNRRVMKLLDRGFKDAPSQVALVRPEDPSIRVARSPMPRYRPGSPVTGLAAIGAALVPSTAAAATHPVAPTASNNAPRLTVQPYSRPLRGGSPVLVAVKSPPPSGRDWTRASAEAVTTDVVLATAAAKGMPVPPPRPTPVWAVQIGAFGNHEQAVARLAQVALSDMDMLTEAESQIDEVTGRRGKLYRVRFHGLAPEDARRACRELKSNGKDCMMVAPRR